jgi:hypothetical protein
MRWTCKGEQLAGNTDGDPTLAVTGNLDRPGGMAIWGTVLSSTRLDRNMNGLTCCLKNPAA